MALLTGGFPLCGNSPQVPGSWLKTVLGECWRERLVSLGAVTGQGGCFRGEAGLGKSYLITDRAWHTF